MQLTKPGPPVTQNFPLFRLSLSATMIYTLYDINGPNLHILTTHGMLHIFDSPWPTSK